MRIVPIIRLRSWRLSSNQFATPPLISLVALAFLALPAVCQRATGDFIAAKRSTLLDGYSWLDPARFKDNSVAADLNGDGKADFVIADDIRDPNTNVTTEAVHSLLNNGDGTFRTVTALTADHPSHQLLVDLDGDGKTDLVSARFPWSLPSTFQPELDISFGNGNGTFAGTKSYTLGEASSFLDSGDVNGDGLPDLVLATSQGFSIFLNGGNRTLKAPLVYHQSVIPWGFTLADVNGDGRSDLIFVDWQGGRVGIALGTSTGMFAPATFYKTGANPGRPAVGDLDGNGIMDLVVPSSKGADVLLGIGNGTFRVIPWPLSAGTGSAKLQDFNHDGKMDLVLVNDGTNGTQTPTASVYTGHGDGTFSAPRVYDSPKFQDLIGILDVNGDGAADLVFSDLTVLLGDGKGAFQGSPITRSSNANNLVTGDFNGDGKPDVAVANVPVCVAPNKLCPITVTILLGSGAGWFQAPKTYQTGLSVRGYTRAGIAAADFNRDGHLDLVVKSQLNPSLSLLLGNGDGSLRAPRMVDAPIGSDLYPGADDVFVTDLNHDHKLDIVVDSGVLLGHGDGTFETLRSFPDLGSPGIQRIGIADFNGDGNLDIVASIENTTPGNSPSYSIAILNGDGAGGFKTSSEWPTLIFASPIIAARMNGDSFPDLVIGGRGVTVLLNKGDGTFPTSGTLYAPGFGDSLAVADFNGDGIKDVVAMSAYRLQLLTGNGNGTLDSTRQPVIASDGAIAPADLDMDGALDFVVATPVGVSRFINSGPPTITPAALVWGTVQLGKTGATKSVAVRNYSKQTLKLHAVVVGSSAKDFAIKSTACGKQVLPGASCGMSLAFAPQASGTRSSVLQVTDEFGNLQKVMLQGLGTH